MKKPEVAKESLKENWSTFSAIQLKTSSEESSLVDASQVSSNMGVCRRQIPDRSCLVVLYLLAWVVFEQQFRCHTHPSRTSTHCHLHDDKRGKHRRRLPLRCDDQTGNGYQQSAENNDVDLCSACRSGCLPPQHLQHVAGRLGSSGLRRLRIRAGQRISLRSLPTCFPKRVVGSVVGIGAFAGALGG